MIKIIILRKKSPLATGKSLICRKSIIPRINKITRFSLKPGPRFTEKWIKFGKKEELVISRSFKISGARKSGAFIFRNRLSRLERIFISQEKGFVS